MMAAKSDSSRKRKRKCGSDAPHDEIGYNIVPMGNLFIDYVNDNQMIGNKERGYMRADISSKKGGNFLVPFDMPYPLVSKLDIDMLYRQSLLESIPIGIRIDYYRQEKFKRGSTAHRFVKQTKQMIYIPFVRILFQSSTHVYLRCEGPTIKESPPDKNGANLAALFVQLCDAMYWLKDMGYYYQDLHISNICVRYYKNHKQDHKLYSQPDVTVWCSFSIKIIDIDDLVMWDNTVHDDNFFRHNIFTVLDNLRITSKLFKNTIGLSRNIAETTMLSDLFKRFLQIIEIIK